MTVHQGGGSAETTVGGSVASRPKNVFVLGYDAYHAELLSHLEGGGRFAFHPLLETGQLREVERLPAQKLLHEAEERLRSFGGPVDAIVTFLDFPATEIAAMLAERHGTRGPSLGAVLRCNHKYWSRVIQHRVAPEHVPAFASFDPWSEDPLADVDLDFPFWIKPFNAFRSHLGFRVKRPEDFWRALPQIREELPRLSEPFARVMDAVEPVEELQGVAPDHCLAEAIIGGRQCTLEGYAFDGDVEVYGVVDSIRSANRSSFSRYQYPSALPLQVQRKMTEVVQRVMREIGFRDGPFNAEFFYDRGRRQVWLLEINPRISQSHCELFEKVDGESHQRVAVDIALGRRPDPPKGHGEHRVAGKFFVRAYHDALVRKVPDADAVARLAEEVPSATLRSLVHEGMWLSELHDQDSYSYEIAWLWIGAEDQRSLLEKHRRAVELLPFELERPDGSIERVEP